MYCALVACISSVFAHIWLTLGAIAQRHHLAQSGAVTGQGYNARLAAAEDEAGKLSKPEWLHVLLVTLDFFFASFVVFTGAQEHSYGEAFTGLVPGAVITVMVSQVMTRARVAVLSKQRVSSVAFAGTALRGSLATLTVQVVVLARFVGFALNYPTDLFFDDCDFQDNMDPATNATWWDEAPLTDCIPDLFITGIVPQSKAKVIRFYFPLDVQINGSLALIYYLGFVTVVFFAARGQGLLHDRLFTTLEMEWTHVFALIFWLLATFGVLVAIGTMAAEWGDHDTVHTVKAIIHGCTMGGIIGLLAVLWQGSVVSVLRMALGETSAPDRNASHVIFASMRFVDGKALPEALQLREELQKRNVHLKIVELTAGSDINAEVFESIEQAEAFLVFGTEDYGEKTAVRRKQSTLCSRCVGSRTRGSFYFLNATTRTGMEN